MRVAVLVVLLAAATPSEASVSCMSQAEARQRFPTLHLYWHGKDHCWVATRSHQRDATPTPRYGLILRVQQKMDEPKWQEAMSEMLPDENTAQRSWVDRWVNIEPPPPIVSRWVDITQVTPPPVIEPKPEPRVVPRGEVLVLVFIVMALTLAIVEVLLRIERGDDKEDRAAA